MDCHESVTLAHSSRETVFRGEQTLTQASPRVTSHVNRQLVSCPTCEYVPLMLCPTSSSQTVKNTV